VPYPFAHPAAVLPLVGPMGRFAVPSALVIGSIVPDLWYFVPSVNRLDSHSPAALLWFCLPVGFLLYALFHRVLKEPLIALLSPRLAGFTSPGLPAAPWHAVAASLVAGALTHIVWDALTHSNDHAVHGHNWLQHASTALGTAVLAWWIWRKLRRAPAIPAAPVLSPMARICTVVALIAAMAISAWGSIDASQLLASDLDATRRMLRKAAAAAGQGFFAAVLMYCSFWQFRAKDQTCISERKTK
jgi:hypothetical protein